MPHTQHSLAFICNWGGNNKPVNSVVPAYRAGESIVAQQSRPSVFDFYGCQGTYSEPLMSVSASVEWHCCGKRALQIARCLHCEGKDLSSFGGRDSTTPSSPTPRALQTVMDQSAAKSQMASPWVKSPCRRASEEINRMWQCRRVLEGSLADGRPR